MEQDKRWIKIVEGTIGTGLKNSMRDDTYYLGLSIAGSRRERRKEYGELKQILDSR